MKNGETDFTGSDAGPSPRTWGRQVRCPACNTPNESIPTHVGQTSCHRTVTTPYWSRTAGVELLASRYDRSQDMAAVEFDGAAGAGSILQNVQGRVRPVMGRHPPPAYRCGILHQGGILHQSRQGRRNRAGELAEDGAEGLAVG